ncbi:MAG: hypothetical protein OHK0053_29700 [Microscillaceae bacterium]
MPKQVFLWALIASGLGTLAFTLFFLLIYALYQNPFLPGPKSLDFFIYLLAVLGGLLWFRFGLRQGQMRFGEGFLLSLITVGGMALLSALFIYVFLVYIDSSVLSRNNAFMIEMLDKNKTAHLETMSQEVFTKIKQDLSQTSAAQMAFYELRVKLLIGLVMSVILSAVLRR